MTQPHATATGGMGSGRVAEVAKWLRYHLTRSPDDASRIRAAAGDAVAGVVALLPMRQGREQIWLTPAGVGALGSVVSP